VIEDVVTREELSRGFRLISETDDSAALRQLHFHNHECGGSKCNFPEWAYP